MTHLFADWADDNMRWLQARADEMNRQHIDDAQLIALRNRLRSEGAALYNTLLEVQQRAEELRA